MASPIPTSISLTHVIFGSIALLALLWLRWRAQPLPYPPGPRPFPIIGNIFDMPQSKFAITWSRFGDEYGSLAWLKIPGQNFLVVNSFEAAKELLEKRTLAFTDRPRFIMINELLGFRDYSLFTGYNDTWKKQRTYFEGAPFCIGNQT